MASVSHIVSGLTKRYSSQRPAPPTTPANTSVCSDVSSPRGSGRARVRCITASIFCSTRQFTAAAAPATSAMPSVAANTMPAGGSPGAARNMPITAQKTISDTTRGLVSARNCRMRLSARVSAVMVELGTIGGGVSPLF